jgi:ribosomal protein L12E/L44/L45/RPP1/RPP2
MTMGATPPAETPTESLEAGTDPVSQVQAQMDTVGGVLAGQAAPVTRQEYDALMKQVTDTQAQIRGIQGVAQRTANEVRAAQAAQESATLREDMTEEQKLQADYTDLQMKQMRDELGNLNSQQAASQQSTVAQDTLDFVQAYGVDPNDARMTAGYTALNNQELTEVQRTKGLMDAIYGITSTVPAETPPVAPLAPAPQTQTQVVPPGIDTPTNNAGGLSTEQDIMTASVTGAITSAQRMEAFRRIGSPLADY